MSEGKVIGVKEAVNKINNGDTIAINSSGGGLAEPSYLIKGLGSEFQKKSFS